MAQDVYSPWRRSAALAAAAGRACGPGLALGWRYAFGRGSSLSFIGKVAIVGLALSIAVLVVVVSVINGFERELERRVFAVLPHLSLNGREPLALNPADIDLLESQPAVEAAVPVVQAVGLAAGTGKVQGMLLTGIVPETYGRVSELARFVEPGVRGTEYPQGYAQGNAQGKRMQQCASAAGMAARGNKPAAQDHRSAPPDSVSARRAPPEAPPGPRDQAGRRLDALTTKVGDGCGPGLPGSLEQLRSGGFRVILGARLAARLGAGVGDRVTLVAPMANVTPAGVFPRQKRFEVAGLLRSESEFDNRAAFTHIDDARRLLRLGERVHGYQVRLGDLFSARQAAWDSLALLGHDRFTARTWMQTHGNLHHAIVVQKATMFVLLAFLVGVAAFNLVSTLVMAVGQRGADIAVLKTMGAATGSVTGGFVVLGALVGGIGIAAGLAAGSAGALALPGLFAWLSGAFAPELMSRYFINYLPVDLRSGDLLAIGGTAFVLCLLSTAPPARRAAKVLPREVLAHE